MRLGSTGSLARCTGYLLIIQVSLELWLWASLAESVRPNKAERSASNNLSSMPESPESRVEEGKKQS